MKLKINYLGEAGGAWAAAAFVAGGGTRVTAVWTWQRARLQAAAVRRALPPVADASAAVHLAGQRFVTNQAARDVLQVARDVAAFLSNTWLFFSGEDLTNGISQGRKGYLVLSHAPLLSEEGAGGALLFTVAVVEHWNQTRVISRTSVALAAGATFTHLGGHTRVFWCTCSCTRGVWCRSRWGGTGQ